MALPPAHPIDGPACYVLSFDSAWKHDELNASLAKAASKGQRSSHPWQRYRVGESRCAYSTVARWIDESKGPVKFHLRRMTFAEWQLVQGRAQTTGTFSAQCLALKISLTGVDGDKVELNRGGDETGWLDDGDMDRIKTLVGDEGFSELTDQAIGVSRSLLEPEKKP